MQKRRAELSWAGLGMKRDHIQKLRKRKWFCKLEENANVMENAKQTRWFWDSAAVNCVIRARIMIILAK